MGIDEELFILRKGIPIYYFIFRRGFLNYYFEENNINIEIVDLRKYDQSGYWIKGEDFIKMLEDIQNAIDNEYTRDSISKFFEQNTLEPNDKIFYKILF